MLTTMWMGSRGRGVGAGCALALLLALVPAVPGSAQQSSRRLTLDDAVRLALDNNPGLQSTRNDVDAAGWGVREAWGRFLPGADLSSSARYTEAGVQRIGILDFGQQSTDWYSSSYRLGLNWSFDGSTLFGLGSARATRTAVDARVAAAGFDVESTVTLRYMAALRAADAAHVAEDDLRRAAENHAIVQARVEAGTAAGTDGKQAEVELGRAEVGLIQTEQELASRKLQLLETLGVGELRDIELVSAFEVFEPEWALEDLVASAMATHPSLRAFTAEESAGRARVREARSDYFPRVSVSAGWGGTALQASNSDFLLSQAEANAQASLQSCQRWQILQNAAGQPLPGIDLSRGCGTGTLTPSDRAAIQASNDVFPFDFTQDPFSVGVSVSIPIFQGFGRQRRVEEAEAAASDVRHQRRAEELRLRTAVTEAFNALEAARRIVEIEETNRELAAERLDLARERYRLGAATSSTGLGSTSPAGSTFLELLDAQASLTRADRDRLNAVYDFHLALAQLEAATGRRLRDERSTDQS